MSSSERPLSPHLQIYRPQLTSMLSILHRMTGMGLAFGVPVMVWWLLSVVIGEEAFATFHLFAGTIIGKSLVFGWLYAMVYHFMNGIRHLFWDAGKGLELKSAYRSGWFVFFGSIFFSILIWMIALI